MPEGPAGAADHENRAGWFPICWCRHLVVFIRVEAAKGQKTRCDQLLGKAGCSGKIHDLAELVALGERPQTQRVQLDEAGGIFLVVGALVVFECDQLFGVERIR